MDFVKTRRYLKFILIASIVVLSSCNDDQYTGFENTVSLATPDKFLQFFNQQVDLPVGQYTIVAATVSAGQSGTFDLQITRDGSNSENITGQWTNSAGVSSTPLDTCSGSPANVCFDLDVQKTMGVSIELSSSLDSILYLVDDSDTPVVLFQQDSFSAGQTESFDFVDSTLNQAEYATAYYAAVDPADARDTLQKFLNLHGFDTAGADEHVIFRDSKDLGYGRDMFMRSYPNPDCGGQVTVFYVKNFQVEIIEGLAYGPVNLEGAVSQDFQHHFGTNAIEFSRGLSSAGDVCSPEPFTRFYTYQSDYSSADAPHPRLLTVNLDNRGLKAVPQPCITCHGGQLKPLDRFGRMTAQHADDAVQQIGDSKSRLQAFEVDTFEFSEQSGFSRAESEEGLRKMNSAVFCSYPGSLGHTSCADYGGGLAAQTNNGEWNGDFAREVLLGWYDNQLEAVGTEFDENFVPAGWQPSPGVVPEGADTLFKEVIAPNCFVCHGKRGNALGTEINNSGDGKDLDFSSWGKFISHAEEIRQLVFEQGRMPLGLLNYSNFWDDPEKSELLASFISPYVAVDFSASHVDAAGNIIPPGQTIARTGPDRITQANAAITLLAQASLFADQFSWTVTSTPVGASVTLSSTELETIEFSADLDGLYELQLTASSSETGDTDSATLSIQVNSGLAVAPRSLTFYNDIVPELNDCATTCHSIGGGATPTSDGLPVWWSSDVTQPHGIPTSTADNPSLGLYEQVRARVNLDNIIASQILTKASNNHHFGGLRPGFDTRVDVGSADRAAYDLFVNWISEGVVCGGTATQCP